MTNAKNTAIEMYFIFNYAIKISIKHMATTSNTNIYFRVT